MRAVVLEGFGGPEVLKLGERPRPEPGAGQLLVRVKATSVNRPDIMQREGRYPPPPGESEVPGLEVAGTVEELGPGAEGFAVGERVFALVGGGGYGEYALAYIGHVMRIPERLGFEQAACICETYITAYMNLFLGARLAAGESALLHGGGGGVNTAAIQLCKTFNPTGLVLVTASAGKADRVAALGADRVIDYREEDFADVARATTEGRGVDVILDHIGAAYFDGNLKALAVNGRLAIIATTSGREVTLDLARLMVKRQTIMGSVLRSRPVAEKAAIVRSFEKEVLPRFADGTIEPVIFAVMPIEDVAEAHRTMEASRHFGKIVLTLSEHP